MIENPELDPRTVEENRVLGDAARRHPVNEARPGDILALRPPGGMSFVSLRDSSTTQNGPTARVSPDSLAMVVQAPGEGWAFVVVGSLLGWVYHTSVADVIRFEDLS